MKANLEASNPRRQSRRLPLSRSGAFSATMVFATALSALGASSSAADPSYPGYGQGRGPFPPRPVVVTTPHRPAPRPPGRPVVVPAPAPVPARPVPPARPGRGRLHTPPPVSADADEVDVANMTAQAIAGLGCDRAGEALRRISNALLANVRMATAPEAPVTPGDGRSRMREEMRRRWRGHMQNPRFWQKVWNRLAEAYRSCELTCFDDGVAIGQISGAGYCAASVSLGGLNGVGGVAFQAPLPLCQNATFTGCQVGYDQAAGAYQGCSQYTSGGYTSVFNEFKSQDCHLDP